MSRRIDERGAIAVWTAVSLLGFIVAVGLGVDLAGHAGRAAEARAIAAQAARAGGQQVRIDSGRMTLDPVAARRAAIAYASATGLTASADITSGTTIRVEVEGRYETSFLGIIGITDLPVSARAEADLHSVVDGQQR